MKRISRNARVSGLAWVAALSLALAQFVVPAASADEPDPSLLTAAVTAESPRSGEPVEEPGLSAPTEEPAQEAIPAAPAPEPPMEPAAAPPEEPGPDLSDPPAEEPSGPQLEAPVAEDPGTAEPASPAEPAPAEPSEPASEPPSAVGPTDPSPALPDAGPPVMPEPEPLLGSDTSLAGVGMMPRSIAPGDVCAIGSDGYPTLDAAISEVDDTVATPTVIRLLTSIDYAKTLDLALKRVIFDLNGFDLKLNGGTQPGLQVTGGTVDYSGAGAFVVTGAGNVVEVTDGGAATVTGIRIAGSHSIGAFAGGEDSRIVVNGDIRTDGSHSSAIGADAAGRGLVIVNGTIWIEGDNTFGAVAHDGGRVTVHVNSGGAVAVSGDYGVGANPRYGGEVVVVGDVTATGADAAGVVALGGIARITGDVTAAGLWSFGIRSADEGDVLVNGRVTVTGTEATGVDAYVGEGSGGFVRVTGSVTVAGSDALGVEAYSRENTSVKSLVTIDGQLDAPNYLLVDRVTRTMDSKDSTESSGHWLYLGPHGSLVKIRNGQPEVTPEPSEPPVTPTPSGPPVAPDPSGPPEPTPDPPDTAEPTPDPSEPSTPVPGSPDPSESASTPSDADELAVTGADETRLAWLLGLMAAMVLGGVAILLLNGHVLRRGGRRGSHEA